MNDEIRVALARADLAKADWLKTKIGTREGTKTMKAYIWTLQDLHFYIAKHAQNS